MVEDLGELHRAELREALVQVLVAHQRRAAAQEEAACGRGRRARRGRRGGGRRRRGGGGGAGGRRAGRRRLTRTLRRLVRARRAALVRRRRRQRPFPAAKRGVLVPLRARLRAAITDGFARRRRAGRGVVLRRLPPFEIQAGRAQQLALEDGAEVLHLLCVLVVLSLALARAVLVQQRVERRRGRGPPPRRHGAGLQTWGQNTGPCAAIRRRERAGPQAAAAQTKMCHFGGGAVPFTRNGVRRARG